MLITTGKITFTLFVALSAGCVFFALGFPLPWLTGPLVSIMVASIMGLPVYSLAKIQKPMITLIGLSLGGILGNGLSVEITNYGLSLGIMVICILLEVSLCYTYFRRVGGWDKHTAYLSSMPAGMVLLVLFSTQTAANDKKVALAHTIRIYVTVLCLPFIFQSWTGVAFTQSWPSSPQLLDISAQNVSWLLLIGVMGGKITGWIKLPSPFLLGPMIILALGHSTGLTEARLPEELTSLAQIVIGSILGCRFSNMKVGSLILPIVHGLASVLLMLVVTFIIAIPAAWITDADYASVVLSYSPGGIAEMAIVAAGINADIIFVTVHHVTRIFLVMFFAPLVFNLFFKSRRSVSETSLGRSADTGNSKKNPL